MSRVALKGILSRFHLLQMTTGFLLMSIVVGCSRSTPLSKEVERYSGVGHIDRTVRQYGPGIESEGFELELPKFSMRQPYKGTWSLSGLPKLDRTAHFEILLFVPSAPASPPELNKLAPPIPPVHRIKAVLFDKKTGAVYAQKQTQVTALESTHTLVFIALHFVKNVFDVELRSLPSTANLALSVEYDTGNQSVESEAAIVVVVDAPTL